VQTPKVSVVGQDKRLQITSSLSKEHPRAYHLHRSWFYYHV
jgi:hypothetical protein